MIDLGDELLAGLPDEVCAWLAAAPVAEKKLLELGVSLDGLPAGQARMVDAVRLFVITWDPLEIFAGRPTAFATINGPADLELVIYAPLWSLAEQATARDTTIVAVLSAMTRSAVVVAAEHGEAVASGQYPAMAARRGGPELLSLTTAGLALGPAAVRLVSAGWEDIGLGAITDIVQHAFGPVDLDRSLVELSATTKPTLGCPACAGRRFGFPAGLAEAQAAMCPIHHAEAQAVINRRFARANASNPDGYGALTDACVRLERPHLPNGLAGKLPAADEAMYHLSDPGALAEQARLVIEAAGWFEGRPADLTLGLGQDPSLAGTLPDWLRSLVFDLGRAGLAAEAVEVGEAISRVDPDLRASLAADVAVALAQAGLAAEAHKRIAINLTTWPDDVWVRLHAGDALAELGDLDGAAAHFTEAVMMADDADDFEARADAADRLRRLDRARRGDPPRRTNGQRKQPRRVSRAQRKRRR